MMTEIEMKAIIRAAKELSGYSISSQSLRCEVFVGRIASFGFSYPSAIQNSSIK